MNLCGQEFLAWAGIQNEGVGWQEVTPSSNGTLVFDATERFSLAFVVDFFGSSITDVLNVTVDEVQGGSLPLCQTESGTRVTNGSVTGVAGNQVVRLSGANSVALATPTSPNWSLTDLPNVGMVDVIATRFPTASSQPPDRVVIRRGVIPSSNGLPLSALDFGTGSGEAHPLEVATVTLTNITQGFVEVSADVFTVNGTNHDLSTLSASQGPYAFAYASIPAALRVVTDVHQLSAFAADVEGVRQIVDFYATPSSKTLAFGPMVSQPTFELLGGSPYLRPRARFASQTEYPALASVNYTQSIDQLTVKLFTIYTSAAYAGGAPTTWELSVPDFGNSGYESDWGLTPGTPYSWDVSAFGGDANFLFGDLPTGATVITATRSSNNTLPVAGEVRSLAPSGGRSIGVSRDAPLLALPRSGELHGGKRLQSDRAGWH